MAKFLTIIFALLMAAVTIGTIIQIVEEAKPPDSGMSTTGKAELRVGSEHTGVINFKHFWRFRITFIYKTSF